MEQNTKLRNQLGYICSRVVFRSEFGVQAGVGNQWFSEFSFRYSISPCTLEAALGDLRANGDSSSDEIALLHAAIWNTKNKLVYAYAPNVVATLTAYGFRPCVVDVAAAELCQHMESITDPRNNGPYRGKPSCSPWGGKQSCADSLRYN